MNLHDDWMKRAYAKDPRAIFTPAIISAALLLRMVDEGRITRQEFDAIEGGYSHLIGTLHKRGCARQQAQEGQP